MELLIKKTCKEPSHSSMLEAKLWHNKTETKNVKVAKMVEFISDQYPRRFDFDNFFNSIILPPSFYWGKIRSSEKVVWEEWVFSFFLGGNGKNLGESFYGA